MSYPNNRSGFGAGFMGDDDQNTIELSSDSEQPAQNPYEYRHSFPITQPTPLKRRRSYSLSLSDHGTGSPLRPITPPDQRIPTPSPPPTVIVGDQPVEEEELGDPETNAKYFDPNKGNQNVGSFKDKPEHWFQRNNSFNDAQPPSDSE